MAYNPNNPNGQTTMANSAPVAFASDQTPMPVSQPDLLTTGQGTQTVVGNNILLASAGSGSSDVSGYRSASVQIVSTGTAGTFIFENSNNNVNFQPMAVYNSALTTATPIVAAITATSSQLIYTFPVRARYVRVRIATTITGGSLQAFSRFSQESWFPAVVSVAQPTAANLATTATIASGTVTTVSTVTSVTAVASVTSSNSAIPGTIADVASAALTTTTTTAAFTPTFGAMYQVTIPVTVVSGTNPTLDVQIQESDDSGTNWLPVFDFPRITATGFYRSPMLPLTGNRVRYVQTVGGTTPSFTRAVNRFQASLTTYSPYRQLIDRSISLTTLNSTTPSVTLAGASRVKLQINIGAATSAPSLQLEGSDDNGSTWFSIGTAVAAVASSTVDQLVQNVSAQLVRARVSTAGTGVTPGYVLVRGF